MDKYATEQSFLYILIITCNSLTLCLSLKHGMQTLFSKCNVKSEEIKFNPERSHVLIEVDSITLC
jgi:hypothetical protein